MFPINFKNLTLILSVIFCSGTRASTPECFWDLKIAIGASMNELLADFGSGTVSDSEMIRRLVILYPDLLKLTGSVNATPETAGLATINSAQSPSKQLFGTVHTEFDRTMVGILAMKWTLEGNYNQISKIQKPEIRLTQKSFSAMRELAQKNLSGPGDLNAMITYMVINDLGKVKSVVADLKQKFNIEDPDHDVILWKALVNDPSISTAFLKLPADSQKKILAGLESRFSLPQFIQGENVAGSLPPLAKLNETDFYFHLLHAVFDLAGAAGHVNPDGSVVMTEVTYAGVESALEKLNLLRQGVAPAEVYTSFMKARAQKLEIDTTANDWLISTRLSLLFRATGPTEVKLVKEVFASLPVNARAIIEKELSAYGIDDGFSVLVYYAPALIANLRGAFKQANIANSDKEALELGLITLARIFQESRVYLKKRSGSGVFTVNIESIAAAAGKDFSQLRTKNIKLKAVGLGSSAELVEKTAIDAAIFPKLADLRNLPGKRIAVVGIGGGSDGIQAAMLGKLFEAQGKDVACVVSVRTSTTGSQGGKTAIGSARTVQNHGGFVNGDTGVVRIKSDSTGEGRFVENIPAEEKKVFLVLDPDETSDPILRRQTIMSRIQSALAESGGVDAIYAVDTGGDALYSASTGLDGAKATPDQDLRVLAALHGLSSKYQVMSVEIAAGVDSPKNAETVLTAAKAQYYEPTTTESAGILDQYIAWRMDGTDEERYGKTPLAWQAALRGQFGMQVLPLPTRIVIDPKNPWITIFRIDPSMRGIFFMNIEDHLKAIGFQP